MTFAAKHMDPVIGIDTHGAFSGGHFFIHEDEGAFLSYLRSIVREQSSLPRNLRGVEPLGSDALPQ